MKNIYFVTSNKWKFDQAKDFFAENEVTIRRFNIELPESRSEDVVEIAKEKAEYAFKKLGKSLFVIDGAFYIKALNDFPKTHVKFVDKYLGASGILKLLEGEKNRKWKFPNVLYFKNEKITKYFTGTVNGTIAKKLSRGTKSGARDFDRILIPSGYKKPYTEFSKKEELDYLKKVWQPAVFNDFISWLKTQ